MARDYYVILGVAVDATPEQIKQAYRQKALQFHPDHYGPNAEPFLEVQEAYAVLGDHRRRDAYDRSVQRARRVTVRSAAVPDVIGPRRPPAEPLIPAQKPFDWGVFSITRSFESFSPSFEEIIDHLWSNFTGQPRPKAERMENLTVDVFVTVGQAMVGGRVRLLVPAVTRCPTCLGKGRLGPFACHRCAGEGTVADEYPVVVPYPPGMPDNYTASVALDRLGVHNLYLTVRFRLV